MNDDDVTKEYVDEQHKRFYVNDNALVVELFNLLDDAYKLLATARSGTTYYSTDEQQWYMQRKEWLETAALLMSLYVEGWEPQ